MVAKRGGLQDCHRKNNLSKELGAPRTDETGPRPPTQQAPKWVARRERIEARWQPVSELEVPEDARQDHGEPGEDAEDEDEGRGDLDVRVLLRVEVADETGGGLDAGSLGLLGHGRAHKGAVHEPFASAFPGALDRCPGRRHASTAL